MNPSKTTIKFWIEEILVGLTVSIVTLSLGAAFGLLSGRGVIVGMLSGAIFSVVTSLLGGTKIQCSGPTGPMTSVCIALITSTIENSAVVPENMLNGFINMTIFLSAIILFFFAVLRLGRFIQVVPTIVISGFMNGVALIIWYAQYKKLFQFGSVVIDGTVYINITVAICTFLLCFVFAKCTKYTPAKIHAFVSATLLSIISMTIICRALGLNLDTATAGVGIHSFSEFTSLLVDNSPKSWPWKLALLSLPWALQFSLVAYLDTLLTSLIVDSKSGLTTKRNQELGAQGFATMLVSFIGGIPGAQATERSVLMIREGAKSRISGVCVGVFSVLGIFLLQDAVLLIPKAVFAGILCKVAFDVFDWHPVVIYLQSHLARTSRSRFQISHLQIVLILCISIMTVAINVAVAVFIGTCVYYIFGRYNKNLIQDLVLIKQTEGFSDEP